MITQDELDVFVNELIDEKQCTNEELLNAFIKALMFVKESPHMLEPDREKDCIDIIKAIGSHIGTPEASAILKALREIENG